MTDRRTVYQQAVSAYRAGKPCEPPCELPKESRRWWVFCWRKCHEAANPPVRRALARATRPALRL